MMRFQPISGEGSEIEGPLSPAQQHIWRFEELLPGTPAFHVCLWVRMTGSLSPERIRDALDALTCRHDALRTAVVADGDRGRALVVKTVAVPLEVERAAEGESEEHLRLRAIRFCERAFALDHAPLWRALLLEAGPGLRFLAFCVHHLVFDGWSVPLLLGDLLEGCLDPESVRRKPKPRVALPGYARWHWNLLDSGELEDDVVEAAERLQGAGAAEIPLDFPRPAALNAMGKRLESLLTRETVAELDAAARRSRVTRASTILAAWLLVLQRYSGQDDLTVGAPTLGRLHEEFEDVVGLFSDLAVLRFDLSGDPLVESCLTTVQKVLMTGLDVAYLPFTAVIDRLDFRRDPARKPLVNHLFAMETSFSPVMEKDGLRLEPRTLGLGASKADASLLVWDEGGGLRFELEYRSSIYRPETAARWMRGLHEALEFLIRNPGKNLGSLRFSDAVEWVSAPLLHAPVCVEGPVLQILGVANAWRDALAVRDEHGAWTYRELREHAAAVATWLRSEGLGAGDRVAICLGRRKEAVACILGVLEAHCAFVPLDESHPGPRLALLMEQAEIARLVTWDGWKDRFSAKGHPHDPVVWEELREFPGRVGETWFNPDPSAAAYVVFTSGTTGVPRAVEVSRGNLDQYCESVLGRFRFAQGWSAAVLQSFAVDFSYTLLFPILMRGGCLRLYERGTAMDPWKLAESWRGDPPDVLKITPSHLASLLREGAPENLLPLRRLILGGEASQAEWAAELLALGGEHMELHNHYGPTETTVGVLTWQCSPEEGLRGSGSTPLGRPLSHARVSVRDRWGNPLPPGAAGELWIGGGAVANGYRNDAKAQSERFLEQSVWLGQMERAYRSGDRVRMFDDEVFEFLGRTDDQIKIRGHRVELAEVASVLESHWSVAQAIAVPWKQGNETVLAAFVTPAQPVAISQAGQGPVRLPHGMQVRHINRHETAYLFEEIFERCAYLRHGVALRRGDTVVDVGGNIGLFALFARAWIRDGRLLVVEPNPSVFGVLHANLDTYAPGAIAVQAALSDREGRTKFTSYPGFSLFSGLDADPVAERAVVEAYERARGRLTTGDAPDEDYEALMQDRFRTETWETPLKTLSGVMREYGIDRIDLLKINAEKSERRILEGLEETDWPRIEQVVLETDVEGEAGVLVRLLEDRGFHVVMDQDPLLRETSLRYVYAVRPGRLDRQREEEAEGPDESMWPADAVPEETLLREYAATRLPEAMIPASIAVVERFPLAANGKIDRQTLLAGLSAAPQRSVLKKAWETDTEERLAGIWSRLLGRAIGDREANFWDSGGHSLLAMQLAGRVRREFGAALRLLEVFEHPVLASLAGRIDELQRSTQA